MLIHFICSHSPVTFDQIDLPSSTYPTNDEQELSSLVSYYTNRHHISTSERDQKFVVLRRVSIFDTVAHISHQPPAAAPPRQ